MIQHYFIARTKLYLSINCEDAEPIKASIYHMHHLLTVIYNLLHNLSRWMWHIIHIIHISTLNIVRRSNVSSSSSWTLSLWRVSQKAVLHLTWDVGVGDETLWTVYKHYFIKLMFKCRILWNNNNLLLATTEPAASNL